MNSKTDYNCGCYEEKAVQEYSNIMQPHDSLVPLQLRNQAQGSPNSSYSYGEYSGNGKKKYRCGNHLRLVERLNRIARTEVAL